MMLLLLDGKGGVRCRVGNAMVLLGCRGWVIGG